MAAKYIWWKTPEEAVQDARRVVAQVMNIGDYEDVQALTRTLGDERLSAALLNAGAGEFDVRSWSYWHYRLRLAEPGNVPPLPRRRVA